MVLNDGKKVGSYRNIGSFSLQSSKVLTSGEGGIMTTSDDSLMICSGRSAY